MEEDNIRIFNFQFSIFNSSKGFSLIEIIVTISAISVLIGMASVNLLGAKGQADIATATNVLISDIRTQQIKTMVGDTEGRENVERYGVYFEENAYTLFHGSVFDPDDEQNFTVELPEELAFTQINVPQSQVVFEIGSGSVVLYNDTQNSVVLRHLTTDREETITLNKYGVITSQN